MILDLILVSAYVWRNFEGQTRFIDPLKTRREESPDVTVRHKSKQGSLLLSFTSSHLDRVADDHFSRDPVGDTVSMCEQLLEGAFRREALTDRKTAAPCWRRRLPAGASRTQTGSYWIYIQSLPIETHWRSVPGGAQHTPDGSPATLQAGQSHTDTGRM